ncbi:tellurite resistance TerB family protein [Roseimaritima multifibrata]|uniref:tellurite resistance TerB family protein n=1 Tax=Roseimaritima multifibrata TaxID=1930274 RepID=UPI001FE50EF6|nr:TerB family tellurite resistance protein [Roseimaritima multifibrata]
MQHLSPIVQLQNIVVMAAADGSLSADEIAFLSERYLELGLEEDDLQRAIAYGLDEKAALQVPQNVNEQESLLRDLARMMSVDQQISENEKRLLALAAAMMKIDSERLSKIIQQAIHSPPPNQL